MGKMNKAWHEANPMPAKPSLDQRIAWHIAHVQNCGCRDMPESVKAELLRRGEPLPARKDGGR